MVVEQQPTISPPPNSSSSSNLALTLKPVVQPPTKKKINVIAINPNDLTLTKENREFKIEAAMDVTVDLGMDSDSVTLAEFLGDVPIRSALEDFDKSLENKEGAKSSSASSGGSSAAPPLPLAAPVQFLLSPLTPIHDSNVTSPAAAAITKTSPPSSGGAQLSSEEAAKALTKELESVVTSAMSAGTRSCFATGTSTATNNNNNNNSEVKGAAGRIVNIIL